MIDFKSVFCLFSFTMVAQVIAFAVYPLLTRMYAPEAFGVMNLFTTIGSILVLFATMDMHSAIPLPQSGEDSARIVRACVCSVCVMFLALCVCAIFGAVFVDRVETVGIMCLLPLYVLALSLWQVVNLWLMRRKQFPTIANYQFMQSVSSSAMKVGLGYASAEPLSLLLSMSFAPVCAFAVMSKERIKEFLSEAKGFVWDDAKYAYNNYKEFPAFSMSKNLMLQLSNGLPVMLLSPVFGMREVGYYSTALVLGFVPIGIMANSVYQVLMGSASEKLNKGETLMPDVWQFLRISVLTMIPVCAVLYAMLPAVTEVLLGEGWGRCGEVLRVMLPWCVSTFVGIALSFVPEVLLRLGKNLWFEVALLGGRLCAIFVGTMFLDFLSTIFLYSVVAFVVRLFQVAWFVKITKERDKIAVK